MPVRETCWKFQSTFSVRRATGSCIVFSPYFGEFQSTFSVRRATVNSYPRAVMLSIFQSTFSVRRATDIGSRSDCQSAISIHVLREESDVHLPVGRHGAKNISIHVLREESDSPTAGSPNLVKPFQSTFSVRRATVLHVISFLIVFISIHVLREESDPRKPQTIRRACQFQSTFSVRRATPIVGEHAHPGSDFNPRSP